ncbi:LysM peptidoglycan-binding domain-containing protein [Chryseobacterium piscium]|uniref:LysM peptidoglycan-binding domain-containing protein n=1 Tax=Chryseobacterium piscium TaxID=333702 RepID=A0A3D9BCL3_9FLAO|nr:LysM peptidoglycan-binding domain-containing protein [Chryseobacterium piscium]REC51344.1 LysM peptidoglycan-binding domain-containing protein [Chryseobacterium piscium]
MAKLMIDTYKDNSFSPTALIKSNAFVATINPTSFSIAYKTFQNTDQAAGTSNTNAKYEKSLAPSLQIEFLFDDTGVTDSNPGNTLINKLKKLKKASTNVTEKNYVTQQITDFYAATGKFIGNIHKPSNVILRWGSSLASGASSNSAYEFKGILTDLTMEYKLFDSEGKPLRVVAKATFSESISPELMKTIDNTNSPDLTHKRTVQDGDTLPLMTERIYGDSKYYLEVAKVNNLIDFRQLKPGSEVYFPPLDKKE